MRRITVLLLSCLLLYGCAVNPVTGKKELSLISENQEISIGQKNYGPSRQMQGGDYTVHPELTVYVNSVGQKLASVSDRKLPYEFVVLNNSTPNAWALPGGKIAVNRGLLVELQSEAELAAVLGHEIVHAAAKHGAQSVQRGMLLQGALIATNVAARSSEYANLVVGGAQVAAGLVHTKYGRDDELEADYYGMAYMSRAGYDPMAAVGLQETFIRLNEGRAHNWLTGLFSSHPPSRERVNANRITAANLPKGGIIGRDAYQNRIASIVRNKDGYDKYAKGREELQKGDRQKAFSFAQQAIKVEPREGHFYALRGDTYIKERRYAEALSDYNRAIELNRNYFYYYLQRGLIKKKLNRRQEAYSDLQASTKLLPTAMAYNSLGELELSFGSHQRARQYFQEAAGSDSPAGRAAMQSLLRLDFPQNAGNYIKMQVGLNKAGYVIARIHNNAPAAIKDVELFLDYRDSNGRRRQVSRWISGVIPAGQSLTTELELGPYTDTTVLNSLRIQVMSAQLVER
jgi:predicted Zn-dependent protease